jgi:hypothetical protein
MLVSMTTNSSALDRLVGRALDLGGETYGDERERLRWYEGMAAASQLQLIVMPLVGAGSVLAFGRPAVVPLALVMSIMYLSTFVTLAYVRRRGVDTAPARWTRTRVVLGLLSGAPYLLFAFACVIAYQRAGAVSDSTLAGMGVGAAIGVAATVFGLVRDTRRRRAQEAAAVPDVD